MEVRFARGGEGRWRGETDRNAAWLPRGSFVPHPKPHEETQ